MGKYSKLRAKILAGSTDSNIEFSDLCKLLKRLEFKERVKGDHHIFTRDFTRDGVIEIINLQPKGQNGKTISS